MSQFFQFLGVRDVVPGYTFLDVVTGYSFGIKLHLNGSGGIRHCFDLHLQLLGLKILQDFSSQFILAHSTHHFAVQSELRYMISEIGRSATDFLSFGQHIPKCLAHTDYYIFFHVLIYLLILKVYANK